MPRVAKRQAVAYSVTNELAKISGVSLPAKHIRGAAWICSTSVFSRRKHKHRSGCVSITYQTICNIFGNRANFDTANAALKLFKYERVWSRRDHRTIAYALQPNAQHVMQAAETFSKTPLIDRNTGVQIRTPISQAINSKDARGQNRKGQANIPAVVSINRANLKSALSHLRDWQAVLTGEAANEPQTTALSDRLFSKPPEQRLEWLRFAIVQTQELLILSDVEHLPTGCIELTYTEAESGRVYGDGAHFQGTIREIKASALAGCWEYDIQACHWAIMAQLSRAAGVPLYNIEGFAGNRQQWRSEIAEQSGLSLPFVKTALTALLYGVGTSGLQEELGRAADVELIQNCTEWQALKKDADKGRRAILDVAKRNRGRILNAFGKSTINRNPLAQCAHLLQGIEAKALHAVMESHQESLALLQHDGWTSYDRLEENQLNKEISEAVDMQLVVEETQLKNPCAKQKKEEEEEEEGRRSKPTINQGSFSCRPSVASDTSEIKKKSRREDDHY